MAVRYIVRAKGKVVDKNVSGDPFRFTLGRGEVIKGWDQGILGMKLGGERRLTVPSNLAYGKKGNPPKIPGKVNLTFDVSFEILVLVKTENADGNEPFISSFRSNLFHYLEVSH